MLLSNLNNLGWKMKTLLFSGVFILGIIAVGLMGSYTIYTQNLSVQRAMSNSQERVDKAADSRAILLDMMRAQAQLIAEAEQDQIRTASVNAIRSLSLLDENIQNLEQSLQGNAKVKELSATLAETRPALMQVIKAARANDDETAMLKTKEMMHSLTRIEELSQQIVEAEREAMLGMMSEQQQAGYEAIMALVVAIGVFVVGAIGLSIIVAHKVTRPLGALQASMESLSNGDLRLKLGEAGKDEIGLTIAAMSKTIQELHSIVSRIDEGANGVGGEAAVINKSADVIRCISKKLHESVAQLMQQSEAIMNYGGHVGENIDHADRAAVEASKVSRHVTELIGSTLAGFERFQSNLEQTRKVTEDLSRATEMIATITGSIQDISGQTNLLALNAAIEAARAGEHGRGFAVVADEVRNLATRTDSFASEIAGLVAAVSGDVGRATEMLGKTVEEARANIAHLQKVAEAVELSAEQVIAIQNIMQRAVQVIADQKRSIETVHEAVNRLSELSANGNEQTQNLRTSAESMTVAAEELRQVVNRFKL
ncbi:MAG: methyl-accepting chemotaxis protein [Pseudomonadota bacterium]